LQSRAAAVRLPLCAHSTASRTETKSNLAKLYGFMFIALLLRAKIMAYVLLKSP
jgi:hypothetical protein